jgi:hypothetical protein
MRIINWTHRTDLWTEQELHILQTHAIDSSARQLLPLLPQRSLPSIRGQIKRLRLYRTQWSHAPIPEVSVPLSEHQRAYLAGHFDGEGCIRMRRKRNSYGPSLSVTAAYLPVLNLYQQHFGGEIRRRRKSANKQLWVWITIRYDECRYFLETIGPLLMEKADQAQLLLQFIQVRGVHPMFRPPPEVRQFSHEIAKQIAALKHVNFP